MVTKLKEKDTKIGICDLETSDAQGFSPSL